jgi:hypothetical protein
MGPVRADKLLMRDVMEIDVYKAPEARSGCQSTISLYPGIKAMSIASGFSYLGIRWEPPQVYLTVKAPGSE